MKVMVSGCWTHGAKAQGNLYQFPLAPDFADTFHGEQGSTAEPGVIPDLCAVDPLEWCPAMVIHGA